MCGKIWKYTLIKNIWLRFWLYLRNLSFYLYKYKVIQFKKKKGKEVLKSNIL